MSNKEPRTSAPKLMRRRRNHVYPARKCKTKTLKAERQTEREREREKQEASERASERASAREAERARPKPEICTHESKSENPAQDLA